MTDLIAVGAKFLKIVAAEFVRDDDNDDAGTAVFTSIKHVMIRKRNDDCNERKTCVKLKLVVSKYE